MTFSKENMNLYTLSFYSSAIFVNEAVFISEQIAEHMLGTLLEISDKFSAKLNVFSYMILWWLNNL